MDGARYVVVAVLLAYSGFSILLIFLNKTVLSKVRQSNEPVTSYSALASKQYFGIVGSDVHFRQRNNIAVFLDYDVFKLTFAQCAFTAFAMSLILRFIARRQKAAPRQFGTYELVTSTLFVSMLLTSNLCVKLIPVSVLPVSRSFTFIFVLAFECIASKLRLSFVNQSSRSHFTVRRCIVYALIVFGYIGAIEIRPKVNSQSQLHEAILRAAESTELHEDSHVEPEIGPKPDPQSAHDPSLLTGVLCGILNSLLAALTSLAIKFTMQKRSETSKDEQRCNSSEVRDATKQEKPSITRGCGGVAQFALCYSMNMYATALCAAIFVVYQLASMACGTAVFILPAVLHDCEWDRPPATLHRILQTIADWLAQGGLALLNGDLNKLCFLLGDAFASLQAGGIRLATAADRLDWQLVGLYAAASLMSVLVGLFNLAQIELCAPLTVQIANAAKSVMLTLIAVLCYDEHHTLVWYVANSATIVATLLYATDSMRPRQPKADLTSPNGTECTPEEQNIQSTQIADKCNNGLVVLKVRPSSLSTDLPLEPSIVTTNVPVDFTKQRSRSGPQQSQAESLKNGHLAVKKRH